MKNKKIIIISILITLILSCSLFVNVEATADSGYSEIVIERDSGRILYQNNANEKKYMASTTKILTAICVIENTDINKIVTVTKDTIGIEGSSIYLEEGEQLSVKELL